ncbi:MAG TPA: LuxR C-terminal-related transcriptional regulator [Thermoanaerobaculia bacterium]|jgi:DNA-binding CsgD family transcriptional regulator|nr:LuxR C-terminal-related transcriptional regulator [Thermoanaerobaculia bacterium]
MRAFDETLERISRSGEAVFAVDSADRIILWNKACERLLSRPARSTIGKYCWEVLCGRDVNGNLYCHRSCAVAYQARERPDDPVRTFELAAKTGEGKKKKIRTSLFSVASYHPALRTLVHVLRDTANGNGNGKSAPAPVTRPEEPASEPLSPVTLAGGDTVVLTEREKEILRSLADGLGTSAIARKHSIAAVTVRNHVQSILHKLDVHTKVAAVVLAYRHGLV